MARQMRADRQGAAEQTLDEIPIDTSDFVTVEPGDGESVHEETAPRETGDWEPGYDPDLAPDGFGTGLRMMVIDKDTGEWKWAGTETYLGKEIEIVILHSVALHVRVVEQSPGDYKLVGQHKASMCSVAHCVGGEGSGFRFGGLLICAFPDRLAPDECFGVRLSGTGAMQFNKQVALGCKVTRKPMQAYRWQVTIPAKPFKGDGWAGSAWVPEFACAGEMREEFAAIKDLAFSVGKPEGERLALMSPGNGVPALAAPEVSALAAPVEGSPFDDDL